MDTIEDAISKLQGNSKIQITRFLHHSNCRKRGKGREGEGGGRERGRKKRRRGQGERNDVLTAIRLKRHINKLPRSDYPVKFLHRLQTFRRRVTKEAWMEEEVAGRASHGGN